MQGNDPLALSYKLDPMTMTLALFNAIGDLHTYNDTDHEMIRIGAETENCIDVFRCFALDC